MVNFSQCPDPGAIGHGGQNISFAVSTDLKNWTWLADDWFSINTSFYSFPGRWDCIAALTLPPDGPVEISNGNNTTSDAGYYGFWTGSPSHITAPWGFGYSSDGVEWTALPPPEVKRLVAWVCH